MSTVKFTPIGDRVILEPLEITRESAGGLIVPDMGKEKSLRGKVLAVGPKCEQCKVDDIVYYPKFGAYTVDLDTDEYLVIREVEIFTIINN